MSDTPQTPTGSDELHRLEQQRRDNRDEVAALGFDPYGRRTDGLLDTAEAASRYDEAADLANQEAESARKAFKKANPDAPESEYPPGVDDRPRVKIAGRVVLHRDNGKLVWMNLRDGSGPGGKHDFQIAVSKRDCAENGFRVAKTTDLGDVIVAEGPLMRTKAGEITCWASDVAPASKCLVPPPEKHAGLTDIEERYRQRYVDLWSSPETMGVFLARSNLVARFRSFLQGRRFVEVETPMLQAQAGGAAARPFTTHMNALELDLFLRIAPELYLKRLLVGGMNRVFEINRNFRNEGVSPRHNPEFTMLELYEAFGDYMTMAELTESMIRDGARMVTGDDEPRIGFGEIEIDYASPFQKAAYGDLFETHVGCSMLDEDAVRAAAEARKLKTVGKGGVPLDHWLLVGELFEAVCEDQIDPSRPTFVIDYPAALCPLTKAEAGRPEIAERFELYIAGMEIANAYTELNDPDVQAERFRAQLAGIDDEESTFRTFDEDFIRALKVGMPPAGGLGVGIDRVCMLLTGQTSIRDVILFPLLRPRA